MKHELIGKVFPVLDQGSIELIDFMGSDLAIAEAAWVSTEGAVKKRSPVPQFLDYLMRHHHWSPFEMCEVKFRIKLPLFLQAQLATHRTASRNQISARYTELPRQNYSPADQWRVGTTGHNKQGSDANDDQDFQDAASDTYYAALEAIHKAEDTLRALGVAPEMCRIIQATSQYTMLYWKIDLRNLMGFLKQRTDSHAQLEMQEYANTIEAIVSELFPHAMVAWRNHVKYAVTFSQDEQRLLAELLEGGLNHWGNCDASGYVDANCDMRQSRKDELAAKLKKVLDA